jgi:cell wall-associated NlpC family hydrolase
VTVKSHGRHRTPGRYNPLSELSLIASRASSPAIKGSAVLAASGGLVAAFAIPANAVGQAAATPATGTPAEGSPATLSISERASEVATSRAAARPALTAPAVAVPTVAPSFGELAFTAVEKPPPPPPPVQTPAAAEESSGSSRSSGSSDNGSSAAQSRPQRVASGGVLDVAASLVGIPYVYGGSTPAGFDCSGFTQYVFAQVGISLGRTTYAQYAQTYAVSDPQPGDLVFYGGSSPWHVGIYAGNGMMYDSPRTGKSTSLRPLFSGSPEIRRIG